jgi:hypothetical protein
MTVIPIPVIDGMCPPSKRDSGYVYLLREREFLKSGEEIYKVGKTINYQRRFNSYPKHSHIICLMSTDFMSLIENKMLKKLRKNTKLKNRKDIGREYFEGDVNIIKKILCRVVKKQ